MNAIYEQDDCAHCKVAKFRPDYPMFLAGCKGCAVRSLAAGPDFHASGLDGSISAPYRKALAQIFGDDIRRGHELVKQQAAALKLARAGLQP